MDDLENNSEKYLTNPDGSYILKKDGTPRRKPGRKKTSELSDLQLSLQAKKKLEKKTKKVQKLTRSLLSCLLYTSPSPRDRTRSRMPSSA